MRRPVFWVAFTAFAVACATFAAVTSDSRVSEH